jgi:hypothetical protein
MRVAISSNGADLEALTSATFGRCPVFLKGAEPWRSDSAHHCGQKDSHDSWHTLILEDGLPTMSGVSMVYGLEQLPVGLFEQILQPGHEFHSFEAGDVPRC